MIRFETLYRQHVPNRPGVLSEDYDITPRQGDPIELPLFPSVGHRITIKGHAWSVETIEHDVDDGRVYLYLTG